MAIGERNTPRFLIIDGRILRIIQLTHANELSSKLMTVSCGPFIYLTGLLKHVMAFVIAGEVCFVVGR